ncbi:MAG: hypothetical protein JSR71_07340 [Proteobacteria bacterium]|nr:hypothetical protein [Pseudomonadota bacterium]
MLQSDTLQSCAVVIMSQLSQINTLIDSLYREHHDWLYAWLKKKAACSHHATGLSHDTFIQLLSLPEMPNRLKPRAYLLVTTNRQLLECTLLMLIGMFFRLTIRKRH